MNDLKMTQDLSMTLDQTTLCQQYLQEGIQLIREGTDDEESMHVDRMIDLLMKARVRPCLCEDCMNTVKAQGIVDQFASARGNR